MFFTAEDAEGAEKIIRVFGIGYLIFDIGYSNRPETRGISNIQYPVSSFEPCRKLFLDAGLTAAMEFFQVNEMRQLQ